MNRFSRIRHHVDMKDVKRRHLEELAAKKNKEKQIEEEKILRQKIYNACKSNWREDILDEGMTTGNVFSTTLSAEGETAINTVNPIDPASYTGTTGVLDFGDDLGANVGTVIRDNGTGIGADGGFNVGGKYLAFQGVGSGTNNSRFAALSPIDSSTVDTLSITAVIGNDVNGGEDPDLTSEGLFVLYKTPAMANASFLQLKPDNTLGDGDGTIIPSPASHNGGLNNYSIKIPEYARAKDTQFILMQYFNSGSEFDHYGITNINFKRRAPLNVLVPLDDPSAISFISVGTNEGDPKKRKKKINDQLEASDKYTKSVMGSQFPGQGTRIDGDDPFRSTTVTSDEDIKASPIGSDEVKKEFGAPQLKAALGQPATIDKADPQKNIIDIVKSSKDKSQTGQPQTSLSDPDYNVGQQQEPEGDINKVSEADLDLTSDEMKSLKNLGITSDQIQQAIANGEESKINDAIEAEKFGNIKDPTDIDWSNKEEVDYFMDKYFQDKGMPQDNTWILMLLSTKVPILRVINSIGSWFNRGKVPGPKGEEGWTWKQLFDDDWLKRQISDKTGKWNPFRSIYTWAADKGGMLTGPTPLVREFVRRLGPMGTELLNKITDIGFEKNIKPEIEAYSDEELLKATEKSSKENPETFNKVFDEILEKDSEYISYTNTNKKLSAITDKYPNSRNSYDVYQAYKKAGIPYWGETNVTEDGSKWVNTYYNKGYSNSMLGKVDVLKKELDTYTITYYQYASWAKQTDPNKPGNPVNDPNFKEVTGGKKNTLYREDLNYPPFKAEIKWLADTTPGFDYGTYEKLNKEFVNTRYQVGKPNQAKSSYPTIKLMSGVTDPKNPGKFESMLKEVLKKEALMMKLSKLQVFDSEDREANKRAYEKAKKEFNDAKNDFKKSGDELVLYYDKLTTAADEATKKMRDYTVKAYDRRKVEREKLQKKYEVERDKARSYYEKNVIPIRDDYNDARKIEKEISKFNIMDIVSNVSRQYLLQTEKERIKNNWKNDSKEETMDFSIEPAQNPFANEDKPYDPFANEVKPGLGAKPGDKLALFGGKKPPKLPVRGTLRGNRIYSEAGYVQNGVYPGGEEAFIKKYGYTPQEAIDAYNSGGNSQSSNTGSSGLGSVASVGGVDATAAATAAASNKDDEELLAGYSIEDKKNVINYFKKLQNNPNYKPKPYELESILRQQRAQQFGGGGNIQVAHFKLKGTNLFERIKSKPFFNPKDIKPPFPENDPPQLDPKTGMHPRYGKQAGRYKKLDPISANAMPSTGDPEIDAVVDKQRTKPKSQLFSKIKRLTRKG